MHRGSAPEGRDHRRNLHPRQTQGVGSFTAGAAEGGICRRRRQPAARSICGRAPGLPHREITRVRQRAIHLPPGGEGSMTPPAVLCPVCGHEYVPPVALKVEPVSDDTIVYINSGGIRTFVSSAAE